MQSFLFHLFEYHHKLNTQLIEVFARHPEKITPAMHRLFSHMLNAHQIWNSRILRSPSFQVFQLHEPENYSALEGSNKELSLNILHTYILSDRIRYQDSKGDSFENTIEEILFHITNHHTHHRGQLMKMLREQQVEPLITDYIYVTRKTV